ncbi:unnamed protein product [Cyclocybe aegerita]|uniref:F-box domain-containing protein n=1 Tax=Cyclocybe aegerita TaxID=1973307 RepID=A0A8S0XSJ8_CYCAE|nr:unnamed protein product [Cyclocybe aegerita]
MSSARTFREEPAAIVPQFDARIAVIDSEIKALEAQKNELEEEAMPHHRRLKACNDVLAPIRRVPFDIIREIARLTVPRNPSATTKKSPLSLCHVSSAWRRAALSLPELWTSLYVPLFDILSFKRYTLRVVEWFARANGQPCSLYLHFHFASPHEDTAKEAHRIFLQGIRSSIGLIRHLAISADNISDALPSFEKAEWVFERLETLELFSSVGSDYGWILDDRQPDSDVVVPPMDLFKTATKLRSVTIEGGFIQTRGAQKLLPWSQLTAVALTEWLRVDDWAEIMESCPQMQRGYFHVAATWMPTISQPKHVLTHLEELRLRVLYCSPSIIELVDAYDLPKLRVLSLEHDGDEDSMEWDLSHPPPANEIPAFKTLETLSFSDVWQETAPLYVLEMLAEGTNLRKIEINDIVASDVYQALFKAMSFHQANPVLPRLSTLHLTAKKKVTDWAVFVEMVRSRCFDVPLDWQTLKELEVIIEQSFRSRERKIIPAIRLLKEALKSCEDAGLAMRIGDNRDFRLRRANSGALILNGWRPWFSFTGWDYSEQICR